ncbi:MAG TPA: DinB family protein [Thermoanaerobaculia bacterium]|nr:DinB family protein [Thermoanaerobaculia bacterium]
MKQSQIIDALAQQQTANAEYWTAFDTATFFQPIGTSWSPAEAVRHLTKSTRPVVQALNAPKLLLRFRFGRSKRPSVSYDELVTRYRGQLDAGGKAGRFAPSQQSESDLAAWRERILSTYAGVNEDLRKAIARWSETSLEKLQLPHPLLGKLTVREMLMFTLYHQRHHIDVVRRRLSEARSTAIPS